MLSLLTRILRIWVIFYLLRLEKSKHKVEETIPLIMPNQCEKKLKTNGSGTPQIELVGASSIMTCIN
ncbi:hypothetical protein DL897_10500 [Thermoflavimicrobium daqui]|jgi:hypothetical protein|uniref:Uncharacterized protein n=2 Tax=Thermoflavimicrobium daqui TaxID=2137476 RepID=A0A364K419_9BACL|nr:hypothetical protein DL897_10500 [Thermoflavimicrobium daqui]